MTHIIGSSKELVNQPYDKFWDAPLTRREAQTAINKLSYNDSELMGMADTASLLLNYILEVKHGFTKDNRKELDDWVESKRKELDQLRKNMHAEAKQAAEGATDERPNS